MAVKLLHTECLLFTFLFSKKLRELLTKVGDSSMIQQYHKVPVTIDVRHPLVKGDSQFCSAFSLHN